MRYISTTQRTDAREKTIALLEQPNIDKIKGAVKVLAGFVGDASRTTGIGELFPRKSLKMCTVLSHDKEHRQCTG